MTIYTLIGAVIVLAWAFLGAGMLYMAYGQHAGTTESDRRVALWMAAACSVLVLLTIALTFAAVAPA
jgi:predicted neutral ceramidase superfamily lipid hydrolase